MNSPTIEIHGTGTHNRGAELMAVAISERLRMRYPECRIVVPPEFGSISAAHAHGFSMTSEFSRNLINRVWWRVAPPNLKRRFGLVDPAQVDVVLDASGFSFSDQWGARSATALIRKMQNRVRRRQPLIMLPQAYGPFRDRTVASATRALLDRSSLACARDHTSLRHIQNLGTTAQTCLYPDFTMSVPPRQATLDLPERPYAAIVPNARMVDKTAFSNEYLEFLALAVESLRNRRIRPVFVVHDAHEDAQLLERDDRLRQVDRLTHEDPRVLKWLLGQAHLVIGSRFHALVSALSQGVPCIGVGWSHKYAELFSDFGCIECIISLEGKTGLAETLEETLERMSDSERIADLRRSILDSSAQLKARSEVMWLHVEGIIDRTFAE